MGYHLLRRLIRTVRPSPRADLENLVRSLVARRAPRRWLNLVYNRLTLAQKEAFYSRFAKLFREHPVEIPEGDWRVNVGGRQVALPLGGHDAWLEWDLAVSILGHEPEVKRTYLNLLRFRRPKLFFDIGANYGLHSAFFLVHGVPTVSFEPNPGCHEYFRRLARRNHVHCDIRQIALGAEEGWAEISFPERETWLGSTNPAIEDRLSKAHGPLSKIRTPQTTLDAFTQLDGRQPDLIKIDTEGNEPAILQGARHTLRTGRAWVIFESWRESGREALLGLFESLGYNICAMPLDLPRPPIVLDRTRLLDSRAANLLALPAEDCR